MTDGSLNKGNAGEAIQQAHRFIANGELEQAEQLCRQLMQHFPSHPEVQHLQALIYERGGQFRKAMQAVQRAIKQQPGNPVYALTLAKIQHGLGRIAAAEATLTQILESQPHFVMAHNQLAVWCAEQQRYEEAERHFRNVITCQPDEANCYINLGAVLHYQGRLEDAAEVYRQAIRLRPDFTMAYRVLMMLESEHHQDDVEAMEALDAGNLTDTDRMHLQFALAKAYEDRADTDQAFRAMTMANRLRRAQFDYDVRQDVDMMERLKSVFDAEFFAARSGWQGSRATPVFIVGMPRSGSTLVESILASHPDVFGAGEISTLSELITAAVKAFPEDVTRLSRQALATIASAYVDQLSQLNRQRKRLVVDKMLGNFRYVGLIKLLFPSARIIHCVRDPIDTCLSCYKNFFVGLMPYTYDLQELGQYYAAYHQLMAHWRTVLPGFVYDLNYESLVQSPEQEMQKLLAFCGLDWDERCLDFHRSEHKVKTASSTQVRQPIYKTSAHAWEKYRVQLQPLIRSLREQGVID